MSGAITAGVGATVVGGYIAGKGAKDAANTSASASRYAADLQNQQYLDTREDMAPYREAGVDSLNTLAGYGRSQVDPNLIPQSNIPQYDPNFDITKDPSYQFRVDEQNRQIDRGSAGMGQMLSGNRLDEIMKRSGDMASQEYGAAYNRNMQDYNINRANEATGYARGVDAYGRAYGEEGDYLNRQSSLANIGQTATTNTGQFGAASAANQGNALMAAGNAQAAGQIGQANAWQGAIGDIGQIAGQNNWFGSSGSGQVGGNYNAAGSGAIGGNYASGCQW